MNTRIPFRDVPLWIPLTVVSLVASTLWGMLTILGAGTLKAVPSEIRSVVLILTSIGNIMAALAALAFWPLITCSFLCMGVLITAGDLPEFRDLACGIGLAHVPVLIGMWIAWILITVSRVSIPTEAFGAEATRQYLESLISVQISRIIVLLAYLTSGGSFVLVVHDLFKTSWPRAIAIVLCPLILYYLGISLLPNGRQ